MEIALDAAPAGINRIRSYRRGSVTIGAEEIRSSLIVTPRCLVRDWPPREFSDLDAMHVRTIAELKPEIVLLGTGATLHFLSPDLLVHLSEAGIGLETMDTGAACRSYNILAGEGREVAAALLMIR